MDCDFCFNEAEFEVTLSTGEVASVCTAVWCFAHVHELRKVDGALPFPDMTNTHIHSVEKITKESQIFHIFSED